MRAILIDPKAQTITEVAYTGDYRNINEHIDADCFDCVRLGDKEENTLFVDDNGLINGKDNGLFRFDGQNPAYLAGKALILATDREGESIATTLTLDEVRSKVAFGSPVRVNGVIVFIEHNTDGEGTGKYWPIPR